MTYRTYHNSLKFLNYIKFKNQSGTFLTPCKCCRKYEFSTQVLENIDTCQSNFIDNKMQVDEDKDVFNAFEEENNKF